MIYFHTFIGVLGKVPCVARGHKINKIYACKPDQVFTTETTFASPHEYKGSFLNETGLLLRNNYSSIDATSIRICVKIHANSFIVFLMINHINLAHVSFLLTTSLNSPERNHVSSLI